MPIEKIDETIPDIYIRIPFQIENKDFKDKYNIQYSIRLGLFSYGYNAIEENTKKEVFIKYISKNSHFMMCSMANMLRSSPLTSNYLLEFIDIAMCKMYNTPCLIFEGGWNNLADLVNWHGPKKYDPYTFFIPALEAISYLHKLGFIHGNIKTSSFWYKQQQKCEKPKCRYICTENLVLGDYEESYINLNNYAEHNFILMDNFQEVQKVSKKRCELKVHNLKYCALKNSDNEYNLQINDIESIFYILFELYEHGLPWELFVDNEVMISKKKEYLRSPECLFYRDTPIELAEIICLIDKLKDSKKDIKEIEYIIKKKFEEYKEFLSIEYRDKCTLDDNELSDKNKILEENDKNSSIKKCNRHPLKKSIEISKEIVKIFDKKNLLDTKKKQVQLKVDKVIPSEENLQQQTMNSYKSNLSTEVNRNKRCSRNLFAKILRRDNR